jgi:hypothetical protein
MKEEMLNIFQQEAGKAVVSEPAAAEGVEGSKLKCVTIYSSSGDLITECR